MIFNAGSFECMKKPVSVPVKCSMWFIILIMTKTIIVLQSLFLNPHGPMKL